jgi:hypothetical protein
MFNPFSGANTLDSALKTFRKAASQVEKAIKIFENEENNLIEQEWQIKNKLSAVEASRLRAERVKAKLDDFLA